MHNHTIDELHTIHAESQRVLEWYQQCPECNHLIGYIQPAVEWLAAELARLRAIEEAETLIQE